MKINERDEEITRNNLLLIMIEGFFLFLFAMTIYYSLCYYW